MIFYKNITARSDLISNVSLINNKLFKGFGSKNVKVKLLARLKTKRKILLPLHVLTAPTLTVFPQLATQMMTSNAAVQTLRAAGTNSFLTIVQQQLALPMNSLAQSLFLTNLNQVESAVIRKARETLQKIGVSDSDLNSSKPFELRINQSIEGSDIGYFFNTEELKTLTEEFLEKETGYRFESLSLVPRPDNNDLFLQGNLIHSSPENSSSFLYSWNARELRTLGAPPGMNVVFPKTLSRRARIMLEEKLKRRNLGEASSSQTTTLSEDEHMPFRFLQPMHQLELRANEVDLSNTIPANLLFPRITNNGEEGGLNHFFAKIFTEDYLEYCQYNKLDPTSDIAPTHYMLNIRVECDRIPRKPNRPRFSSLLNTTEDFGEIIKKLLKNRELSNKNSPAFDFSGKGNLSWLDMNLLNTNEPITRQLGSSLTEAMLANADQSHDFDIGLDMSTSNYVILLKEFYGEAFTRSFLGKSGEGRSTSYGSLNREDSLHNLQMFDKLFEKRVPIVDVSDFHHQYSTLAMYFPNVISYPSSDSENLNSALSNTIEKVPLDWGRLSSTESGSFLSNYWVNPPFENVPSPPSGSPSESPSGSNSRQSSPLRDFPRLSQVSPNGDTTKKTTKPTFVNNPDNVPQYLEFPASSSNSPLPQQIAPNSNYHFTSSVVTPVSSVRTPVSSVRTQVLPELLSNENIMQLQTNLVDALLTQAESFLVKSQTELHSQYNNEIVAIKKALLGLKETLDEQGQQSNSLTEGINNTLSENQRALSNLIDSAYQAQNKIVDGQVENIMQSMSDNQQNIMQSMAGLNKIELSTQEILNNNQLATNEFRGQLNLSLIRNTESLNNSIETLRETFQTSNVAVNNSFQVISRLIEGLRSSVNNITSVVDRNDSVLNNLLKALEHGSARPIDPNAGTSSATPSSSAGTSSATPSSSAGTSSATPSSSAGTSSATPSSSAGTSSATPSSITGTGDKSRVVPNNPGGSAGNSNTVIIEESTELHTPVNQTTLMVNAKKSDSSNPNLELMVNPPGGGPPIGPGDGDPGGGKGPSFNWWIFSIIALLSMALLSLILKKYFKKPAEKLAELPKRSLSFYANEALAMMVSGIIEGITAFIKFLLSACLMFFKGVKAVVPKLGLFSDWIIENVLEKVYEKVDQLKSSLIGSLYASLGLLTVATVKAFISRYKLTPNQAVELPVAQSIPSWLPTLAVTTAVLYISTKFIKILKQNYAEKPLNINFEPVNFINNELPQFISNQTSLISSSISKAITPEISKYKPMSSNRKDILKYVQDKFDKVISSEESKLESSESKIFLGEKTQIINDVRDGLNNSFIHPNLILEILGLYTDIKGFILQEVSQPNNETFIFAIKR
jgi:hypothetical protein